MSVEAIKEFLVKVAGDQELAKNVDEAGSDVDELIRIGREQGFKFTVEDLKAVQDETEKQMGEGLLTFLEKVATDEELARKLREAGTDVDEIIRLGKENGYEFTADNLKVLQDLTVTSDVELSDEELKNVAGGIVSLGLVAIVAGGLLAVLGASVGVGAAVGHYCHVAGKK